jgi:hypothetical protein
MKMPDLSQLPPELREFYRNKFDVLMTKKDKFILDENRNVIPANLSEWSTFIEEKKKRRVAKDKVNGKRISTVFLGIDYNFDEGEGRPPHVFETMVFDKDFYDIYCIRCSTWNEAEEQHQIAIQWVKDEFGEEKE